MERIFHIITYVNVKNCPLESKVWIKVQKYYRHFNFFSSSKAFQGQTDFIRSKSAHVSILQLCKCSIAFFKM